MAWAGYNRALLMWFWNFLLPAISVITSYNYKTQIKIWMETLTILSIARNCTKTVSMSSHKLYHPITFVFMIGKIWYDLFLALITHMKRLSIQHIYLSKTNTFFGKLSKTPTVNMVQGLFLHMLFEFLEAQWGNHYSVFLSNISRDLQSLFCIKSYNWIYQWTNFT